MKAKAILGLSIMALSLVGCVGPMQIPRAIYNVQLTEVERPQKAKERFGQQIKIQRIEQDAAQKYQLKQLEGSNFYLFEDEMVSIAWAPLEEGFFFDLSNKTDHSIKIIWDDAAYVDTAGKSHRVVHEGVRFSDKNNSQPPSIIVRRGSIQDSITPSDYIYFFGGRWDISPLFPNNNQWPFLIIEDAEVLRAKVRPYIGKTAQILLPLQIQDTINDYIFVFEVKDVQINDPKPQTGLTEERPKPSARTDD